MRLFKYPVKETENSHRRATNGKVYVFSVLTKGFNIVVYKNVALYFAITSVMWLQNIYP